MHFLPTADQVELQQGVRDVLRSAFPIERLPEGWSPGLWTTLTETGVFGLRTDLDLGLADAALVFEELGRACVPGPLVGSFLVDGPGMGPVTVLETETHPLLVAHLASSRSVLVLSREGAAVAEAGDLRGHPVASPLDPLTPLTELAGIPAGRPVADPTRLRHEGAVLTAALQVGLAARMTELAVEYAKQREQFGRPIGSFQAVKHICADMFVRTELARVAVHAAAVVLDDAGTGEPVRAVGGAKLLADEAATTNARACVQVHGGMGFTWEVPVHYFVKRAWVHATEFGTADEHAEDVAEHVRTTT